MNLNTTIKKLKEENESGFTLIELLVVITIIAILAVAFAFDYSGWMGRYNIESEIKQIQSDLFYARAQAMARSRYHFFFFPSTITYTIYDDTNPGPDGNGTLETGANLDTQLPGFPRPPLRYPVTWAGGNIVFDGKGFLTASLITITPNTPGIISVASAYNPDYNCILLTNSKINIGQLPLDGTHCLDGTTSACCVK